MNFLRINLIVLFILNITAKNSNAQNYKISSPIIEKWISANRPLFLQNFSLNPDTVKIDGEEVLSFNSIKINSSDISVPLSDKMIYIEEVIENTNEDKIIVKAKELSYIKNGDEFLSNDYIIDITDAFKLSEIDTLPYIFKSNNPNLLTNLFFNIEFNYNYNWLTSPNNSRTLRDSVNVKMLVNAANAAYKYKSAFQKNDYDKIFTNQFKNIYQNKTFRDSLTNFKYIPEIEFELSEYDIKNSLYTLNYFQEHNYFNRSLFSSGYRANYLNNTGYFQTKVMLNDRNVTSFGSPTESIKIHVNDSIARKIEEELINKPQRYVLIRFNTERELTYSLNDKNILSNCLSFREGEFRSVGDENTCIIDYNITSIDFVIGDNFFRIKI